MDTAATDVPVRVDDAVDSSAAGYLFLLLLLLFNKDGGAKLKLDGTVKPGGALFVAAAEGETGSCCEFCDGIHEFILILVLVEDPELVAPINPGMLLLLLLEEQPKVLLDRLVMPVG